MVNKCIVTVCIVLIVFPIYGREKKAAGEIFDQGALAEVQSYCIEKGGLSDSDHYLVDGFLKAESKPKHLLSKIPWKLMENCETGSSDATVKLEIVPLASTNLNPGQIVVPPVSQTDSRDPDAPVTVILTVKGSGEKLLYRAQAMPLTTDGTTDPLDQLNRGGPVSRQDSLYHVFWELKDDLLATRGPK